MLKVLLAVTAVVGSSVINSDRSTFNKPQAAAVSMDAPQIAGSLTATTSVQLAGAVISAMVVW